MGGEAAPTVSPSDSPGAASWIMLPYVTAHALTVLAITRSEPRSSACGQTVGPSSACEREDGCDHLGDVEIAGVDHVGIGRRPHRRCISFSVSGVPRLECCSYVRHGQRGCFGIA